MGTESWLSRRMERLEKGKPGKVTFGKDKLEGATSQGKGQSEQVETRRLVNQGNRYTMKIYQCEEGEEEVMLINICLEKNNSKLFQLICVKGEEKDER